MSINTSRIFCSLSINQKRRNVNIMRTKHHFFSIIWYGWSSLKVLQGTQKVITPWKQDVNWTYIRKNVMDIFCTLYVRSIYVLKPGAVIVVSPYLKYAVQYLVFMNSSASQNFSLFWTTLFNQRWFFFPFH